MRNRKNEKGLGTLALIGILAASPFVLLYGLYGYFLLSEPGLERVVPFKVAAGDFEVQAYRLGQPAADLEIVFVHGTPGDANAFHAQFRHPYPKANLVAIDRPGFGGSGGELDTPSLTHQVEALRALLETPAPPRILVGHSYGGPVVAQAAIDHPDRIAAILLIGGSVDPKLEETLLVQELGNFWPVRQLVPGALALSNRELMTLEGDLRKLDARFGTLRVPIGMLHGGKDTLVPVGNVDYVEKKLAAAGKSGLLEKFVYPDYNHFIPWEHPEAVEAAITRLKGRMVGK